MASVTLILKENKVNSKGELPLYIRIIKGRKAKFISLGIKVHPGLWNSERLRVKSQFPNSARINALIARKLAEAEDIALQLEIKGEYISSKKIKEEIKGSEPPSLIKFMQSYLHDLKSKGKIGTYDKVWATLSKLNTYINNKDLLFPDFDLKFLKSYEKYLREVLNNSPNTIHGNLKIFRKVFNDAIREDMVDASISPFSKFKLKWEKTKKDYLEERELHLLEEVKLKDESMIFHHRNMFIFAAYAGGLRISDILLLRWKNFDNTHIRLYTQKTNDTIQIKLPHKAIEIIEYYRRTNDPKPSDFIFPIFSNHIDVSNPLECFKAISSATAHTNKNLKRLAIMAGIEKRISFHSSRHTFATQALRKGIRLEYVSKLLGHSSLKTTQIYAKIVNAELDSAMDVFNTR